MTSSVEITCPHCGERFDLTLDPGGGPIQEFVYDCEVCCRPIVVSVSVEPGGAVSFRAEPESGE